MDKIISAVEWLENELADNLKSIIINKDYELMEKLFEQAREKENQHKKELIDFADYIRNNPHTWEWVNPDKLHDRKTTKELFELFKQNLI